MGTTGSCWERGTGKAKMLSSFSIHESSLGSSQHTTFTVRNSWMGIQKYLGSNWEVLEVSRVLPEVGKPGVLGE